MSRLIFYNTISKTSAIHKLKQWNYKQLIGGVSVKGKDYDNMISNLKLGSKEYSKTLRKRTVVEQAGPSRKGCLRSKVSYKYSKEDTPRLQQLQSADLHEKCTNNATFGLPVKIRTFVCLPYTVLKTSNKPETFMSAVTIFFL